MKLLIWIERNKYWIGPVCFVLSILAYSVALFAPCVIARYGETYPGYVCLYLGALGMYLIYPALLNLCNLWLWFYWIAYVARVRQLEPRRISLPIYTLCVFGLLFLSFAGVHYGSILWVFSIFCGTMSAYIGRPGALTWEEHTLKRRASYGEPNRKEQTKTGPKIEGES